MELRPAEPGDAPAILEILREPEVAPWWGHHDLAGITEALPDSLVIEIGGEVAGWLQCHEETTEHYPSVAFDIALATRFHGRGHGRAALAEAIRRYADKGHHRFTIDPATTNERAIRCYEALGFKPIGVMRRYEKRDDGTYRDGLLMDLLADELRLPLPQR